tara:strand:- start:9065 stop:9322 length:258 start_codon:yes stop_codon:yes gene_type:complete
MPSSPIHALLLLAAVIIPGGLLAYMAWRAYARRARKKALEERNIDPIEELREAFFAMYPPESLRAKEKRQRLDRRLRSPRKKPPE